MTPMALPVRILYVVNVDWFFWSHRLEIARAARDRGAEVWVAAASTGFDQRMAAEGFRFLPIPFSRSGTNVVREARTMLSLYRLFRRIKPDLIHNVTIKPILYGSWMARLARCPVVVNAISGLGYVFLASGRKARLSRLLVQRAYKSALAGKRVRVVFQNPDDMRDFVERGLVDDARAIVIRGSGVDVAKFTPSDEPGGIPLVMLATRLLRDKGVVETVRAARLLRAWKVGCRVALVGNLDLENPASVSKRELDGWLQEGCVEWWGHRSDMDEVLRQAAVVVLPSYREGLPRVLLEAASVGRPIVATDVPGCREIVRDGVNGFLVPPRDPAALARAVRRLVEDPGRRARMGARSREIAVTEFREEIVVEGTLSVYEDLIGRRLPKSSAAGAT